MWWSNAVAAALAAVLLTACGFQPLYAERPRAVTSELAEIFMPAPKGGSEVLLYNELRGRLTPAGVPVAPRYRLDVSLAIAKQSTAFARDQTATRQNVTATVTYILRAHPDGAIIISGSARAIASHNIVRSEYATLIAERGAEERAVKEVSVEVHNRLAVLFDRRSGA